MMSYIFKAIRRMSVVDKFTKNIIIKIVTG